MKETSELEPTTDDLENLKFEVPPKLPVEIPDPVVEPTTAEQDFDKVQENLKKLIIQGTDALKNSIHLAQELDKPFAYAAVAQIMNSVLAVNKDLIDLHKKKKDYTKNEQEGPKTVNQNLYITTSELSKMLRQHDVIDVQAEEIDESK